MALEAESLGANIIPMWMLLRWERRNIRKILRLEKGIEKAGMKMKEAGEKTGDLIDLEKAKKEILKKTAKAEKHIDITQTHSGLFILFFLSHQRRTTSDQTSNTWRHLHLANIKQPFHCQSINGNHRAIYVVRNATWSKRTKGI